jgi:PEP-CTERM motif
MKTHRKPKALLLALCFSASLAAASRASTISWETLPGDLLFDSGGVALTAAFSFDLGTFEVGFTPDETNMSQWLTNWRVFDTATAGAGWDPGTQSLSWLTDHTATGESASGNATPGAMFPEGTQAYLWVYTSKDIGTLPEWALLMDQIVAPNLGDDWLYPDPALQSGEQFNWRTGDLDAAIFGAVNGSRSSSGSFTAPSGAFTLQTHLVPEPSGLLLMGAGLLALHRRKRQSNPRVLNFIVS